MAGGDNDLSEPMFIEFVPMQPANGRARTATPRQRLAALPPEALGRWRPEQPEPEPAAVPPMARNGRNAAVVHEAPAAPEASARRDTRSGYQDGWLNGVRHAGAVLELRCLDGTVLTGRLLQFDTFSLILEAAEGQILIFKHAVATVRVRQEP